MSSAGSGRLMIVASAVVFSTGGAAIKLATLDAWQIAGIRSAIAALVLLTVLPEARRRVDGRTLLVGLAYALTLVLYVAANRLTTAAHTIFLQSTAPLYVLLFAPRLLRERATATDAARMAAILAGMVLLFSAGGRASATAPDPLVGNLLALACGATWAGVILGLRLLATTDGSRRRGTGASACVAGNVMASALCLPLAFPLRDVDSTDVSTLLYLGAIQVALAYVLLIRGSRSVPAFDTSLILLIDPVLNPVWAWTVHGERPGLTALLGGGLILVASTIPGRRAGATRPN